MDNERKKELRRIEEIVERRKMAEEREKGKKLTETAYGNATDCVLRWMQDRTWPVFFFLVFCFITLSVLSPSFLFFFFLLPLLL